MSESTTHVPDDLQGPYAEGNRTSRQLPELEVVIEIPSGSFLKRGSTGQLDFVSPFPCPFNYGSVETLVGLEGEDRKIVV